MCFLYAITFICNVNQNPISERSFQVPQFRVNVENYMEMQNFWD